MLMEKKNMAYATNQTNVINTLLALGRDVDQATFDSAFEARSLTGWAANLQQTPSTLEGRQAFVRDLYKNILGEDRVVSEQEVDYWVSTMGGIAGDTAGLVALKFAFAATNSDAEDLTAYNTKFETVNVTARTDDSFAGGQDDGTDPDPAPEFDFSREFTKVAREDGPKTGDIKDNINDAVNNIWNIGRDAIDQGLDTRSSQYTLKMNNILGNEDKVANAWFLSPLLNAEGATTSLGNQLNIEVIDRLAADKATGLQEVLIRDFSFRIDGEAFNLVPEEGTNPFAAATTYAELLAVTNAQLAAMGLSDRISAELVENGFNRTQFDPNDLTNAIGTLQGDTLVLKTLDGSEITRGGFDVGARPTADRNVDPSAAMTATDVTSVTDRGLISTNIEVSNIGYGSQGIGINASGQSPSDKTIQHFNVEAKAGPLASTGVWLSELTSVSRVSVDETYSEKSVHGLESIKLTGNASYFKVGKQDGESLAWGDYAFGGAGSDELVSGGLFNVREFNGKGFNQVTEINANIDLDTMTERDRAARDEQSEYTNEQIKYELGNGNNKLYLAVEAIADKNTLNGENASLLVDMGNGNNTVFLDVAQSVATGAKRENLTVKSGSGKDYIEIQKTGQFKVESGSGNDMIFINGEGLGNGGSQTIGTSTSGQTLVKNTVLYQAKVKVSFAGFEADALIATNAAGKFIATQWHINQAIKKAIADDAVLSSLLEVEDGPGNTLIINGQTDGVQNLGVEIIQPTLVTGTAGAGQVAAPTGTTLDALKLGLMQLNGVDSDHVNVNTATPVLVTGSSWNGLLATDGDNGNIINPATAITAGAAADGSENNSVINAGAGNNVISLSSHAQSNNIIEITVSGQNNKLSLLNFDTDTTGNGADQLDFSTWLNATNDPSSAVTSNTLSTERDDVVVNDDLTTGVSATTKNVVTVLNFSDLRGTAAGELAADAAFGFSSGLLAALNVQTNTAALAAADVVFDNATKHIFLIHNDLDAAGVASTLAHDTTGQFLVFAAQTAKDAGVLTNGVAIGVIDFGQTFANNADAVTLAGAQWDAANFA